MGAFARNALQPVARTYQDNMPDRVRDSVHNFGQRLRAPFVLANDVLKGNMGRAWTTTQRFIVRSTAQPSSRKARQVATRRTPTEQCCL